MRLIIISVTMYLHLQFPTSSYELFCILWWEKLTSQRSRCTYESACIIVFNFQLFLNLIQCVCGVILLYFSFRRHSSYVLLKFLLTVADCCHFFRESLYEVLKPIKATESSCLVLPAKFKTNDDVRNACIEIMHFYKDRMFWRLLTHPLCTWKSIILRRMALKLSCPNFAPYIFNQL